MFAPLVASDFKQKHNINNAQENAKEKSAFSVQSRFQFRIFLLLHDKILKLRHDRFCFASSATSLNCTERERQRSAFHLFVRMQISNNFINFTSNRVGAISTYRLTPLSGSRSEQDNNSALTFHTLRFILLFFFQLFQNLETRSTQHNHSSSHSSQNWSHRSLFIPSPMLYLVSLFSSFATSHRRRSASFSRRPGSDDCMQRCARFHGAPHPLSYTWINEDININWLYKYTNTY